MIIYGCGAICNVREADRARKWWKLENHVIVNRLAARSLRRQRSTRGLWAWKR